MGMSIHQQVAARRREARAVEMRMEGETYSQIASGLGYADASGARKAVQRGLAQAPKEAAREFVVLQYERLNDMLHAVWDTATDDTHPEHIRAIEKALSIMDRMDRLVGRR